MKSKPLGFEPEIRQYTATEHTFRCHVCPRSSKHPIFVRSLVGISASPGVVSADGQICLVLCPTCATRIAHVLSEGESCADLSVVGAPRTTLATAEKEDRTAVGEDAPRARARRTTSRTEGARVRAGASKR